MRHSLACGLILLATLAACRAPVVPTAKPSATPRAAAASATPTPTSLSSTPPPPSEGPTTLLSGNVKLDARFMVDTAGGKLIGERGSGYVALGEGRILSDAGSGLLSDLGAGLITDNGTGIIANNGSGLITDNGTGIIANNSSGLISPGGAGWRLLAESGVDTSLTPIGGLAIVPIDMARGKLVGRAFYTDARGHFEARVPAESAGNVALVALVPGSAADDPKLANPGLQWSLVLPSVAGASAAFDEDTALVSDFLLTCFASRLEIAFGSDDIEASLAAVAGARKLTGQLKEVVSSIARELRTKALEAEVDKLPAAERTRLARRVTATVLAHMPLATIKLDPALSPGWKGPQEPALPAMASVWALVRQRTGALLEQNPRFFQDKAYLEGTPIKRGADLGQFIVSRFLVSNDPNALVESGKILIDVDARLDPVSGLDQEQRLRAAYYAIVTALGQTLTLDEAARADAFAMIAAGNVRRTIAAAKK